MKTAIWTSAAAALLVALPFALVAKPFTLEQVRSYAYPENLISAEKSRASPGRRTMPARRNVWVAEGKPLTARQVTSYTKDDGQELTSLAISADGSRIVYVRGGEHGANWDGGLPVNVLSDPAGTKVEVWVIDIGCAGRAAHAAAHRRRRLSRDLAGRPARRLHERRRSLDRLARGRSAAEEAVHHSRHRAVSGVVAGWARARVRLVPRDARLHRHLLG